MTSLRTVGDACWIALGLDEEPLSDKHYKDIAEARADGLPAFYLRYVRCTDGTEAVTGDATGTT